jgi:hypothetical protein
MACLLIRIESRRPGQPGAYTAGDVVAALPDDHQFSPAELSGGVLRVVRVAGIPPASMRGYLMGNAGTRRSQGFRLTPALHGLLSRATGIVDLDRATAWALLAETEARGAH